MSHPVSLSQPASTSNRRVVAFHDLPTPEEVLMASGLSSAQQERVEADRQEIADIFAGDDDRLAVVVGPCSIHDPEAAHEYAQRLAPVARALENELKVVMRVYFEKPRTTVGWKGLINDPHLDGSCDVATGLRLAREVLVDVVDAGLPAACEFLEPNSPQYVADAVAWGAIGARTTESQVHRQLASGLSMPIGFKNGTDGTAGSVQVAIDAVAAARQPHYFFGTSDAGRPAVVETAGNPHGHIILRGGTAGPHYGAAAVAQAVEMLGKAGAPQQLMIDASHANSGKDHVRQAVVARDVVGQIAAGNRHIAGLMLESFLVAGAQKVDARGRAGLVYGQSITDACMDWDTTVDLLADVAQAVRRRRVAR